MNGPVIPPGHWGEKKTPSPYGTVPDSPKRPDPIEEKKVEKWHTPSAWKSREPRAKQPDSRMGFLIFSLFLAAISAVSLLGTLLHTTSSPVPFSAWCWEDAESEELIEKTTIERAPANGDAVLLFSHAQGDSLTPNGIYQKAISSIVSVRVTLEDGIALGTGVILSENGYIITNSHVIEGGSHVDVILPDNSHQNARLVGEDQNSDLAVLKVEADHLTPAEFGDSTVLQVGDPAYAIGNPLGEELRGTMTEGIVSAVNRAVWVEGREMTLVQTTAALNTGNSGGALLNAWGQVVGITNMKMMSRSGWNTIEGLGFAIPTETAKPVVDQLISFGRFIGAPMLGITVSEQAATDNQPAGLLVEKVDPDSDAYFRGLRVGHILLEANGQTLASINDLTRAKSGLQAGEGILLTVWTPEGIQTMEVHLMLREA